MNEITFDDRDYFILALNDARTGLNLLGGSGIEINGSKYTDGWYSLQISIVNGLDTIPGKAVSVSYSGLSKEDLATSLRVDEVSFKISCGQQARNQNRIQDDSLFSWEMKIIPISK